MSGHLARNALQGGGAEDRIRDRNLSQPQRERQQRKRAGVAKVRRWRAGEVPEWAAQGDAAAADGEGPAAPSAHHPAPPAHQAAAAATIVDAPRRPEEVARPSTTKSDPRLERLAGAGAAQGGGRRPRHGASGAGAVDHPIPSPRAQGADGGSEDEDEDARLRARRARIRALQLEADAAAAAAEAAPPVAARHPLVGTDGGASSSSSYYETDSEDDDAGPGASLTKPVFVSRAQRDTLPGSDAPNRVQTTQEVGPEAFADRRREAHAAAMAAARADEADASVAPDGGEGGRAFEEVDTDDERDPEGDLALWQARELERLRLEWNLEHGTAGDDDDGGGGGGNEDDAGAAAASGDGKGKGQRGFLQKYYHKGAFFQSGTDHRLRKEGVDALYLRDYSEATGNDRGVDKKALPSVLQIRGDLGKRGRTKWTHLANEDTSRLGDGYDPTRRAYGGAGGKRRRQVDDGNKD